MRNHLVFLSFVFAFAFLQTGSLFAGPNRTTYQAKIVKPDGYPLEAANVNFKFTILDPAGSCILYAETYSSVNMTGTGGLISFALGSGVKTYPVSATTFEQVFSNITPSLTCDAGGPPNYVPGSSDARKIVMQFHDGTGWQTLPAMAINAVPYAMYANSAQNLNGKVASDFVQVAALSTCGANAALTYNGVGFSCVTIPTPETVSAAAVVSALGYTPADGASVTALTSSLSSTNTNLSSVSSTVSSVSSTVASVSSTVFSVSSTVSTLSNTVSTLQSTVAASFAAITSSQWVTSGTAISYSTGRVGIGTTTPATRLDVSGGVRISMEAAGCAAGLAGTLRYNSGTVEYCNGASWLPFGVAGAGITNINGSTSGSQTFATGITGTVFNISTTNGVHTFNIPLAASSSVTAGLLSNADYLTFTNKLNATSAAVISALGFTPADNAASGTYVVKANNLSDLTSSATARTNLGLGSLATLNFLDLGSASASGTLSVTSLPSVGSGVVSGSQYTKVTVDGKGRVVSGAQLSSSDVTTALGFTPGAATSGVTSLNGSTSQTQTFASGSSGNAPAFNTLNGVHTLNIPLASATGSVTAGLISNADYLTFTNKLNATSAAVIAALGFTPADNAASGTYAVKSNNLSDLASATVARTNLGLGSLATLNFLDLGTSFASGTLAAARLPAFSGDATSSIGSSVLTLASVGAGVVSGTPYTKVTVDGKGRVVSGAQLSSSDVTTALGFTPAQSTSATQWATSGSAIYYNAGNVGIGTNNPTDRLTVAHSSHAKLRVTGDSDLDDASISVFESSPAGAESGFEMLFDGNNVVGGNSLNFNSYIAGASATRMTILRDTGYVGLGTSAPVTRLEVAGGLRISMEAAACSVGYAGTLRYNGGNVEYCNGSIWTAFGAATVGVNSLNGSASQTQTFANGSTGNAPAFSTANGIHTLNIPLASATGSVTAGLISNADYLNFSNKVNATSAAVIAALGYTPASATVLANYLLKSNNLSDLTSSATARTNLGLGTFATANTIDLGSASATGTLAAARLPAFTGDVSSTAGSNSVVVDGLQGRAVAVTAPTSGQVLAYDGSAWAPATNVSSQWTTLGNNIYYNTGNVGVGVTVPAGKLSVVSGGQVINFGTGGNTSGYTFNFGLNDDGINFDMSSSVRGYNFKNANGQLVTISSGGNMGIGASTPASRLVVKGAGATSATSSLNVTDSANTSLLLVRNDGSIGVGITNPEDQLHLNKVLKFTNNTVSNFKSPTADSFRIFAQDDQSNGNPYGTGDNNAKIFENVDGNNPIPDDSFYFVNHGSSGPVTALAIKGTGKVGIGTTTPDRNVAIAENTGGNGRGLGVRTYNTINTGGVIEVAGALGTSTAPLALTVNKSLGFYTFAGHDGVSFAMQSTPTGMYSHATENWSAVSHGANIKFATTPNGAANGLERMRIDQNGYVGIGTTAPSVELEVSGTVKAVAYLYTSDRRLKKDIVTLPDALTKVLQLRGVNFVWRNTEEKTVGFIAQEVEAVYPELVKTDKQSGFKAVQYGNIVAILVEALKQENKERVEAQNRCEAQVSQVQRAVASVDEKSSVRMNQLEKENKELKERLDKLEKLLLKK